MRLIHTSDWHIGKVLNEYSLLEDQRYYFDHFIKKLELLKPDALLISGDLYDRAIPSAEAIALLNQILCKIVLELKIETFIIAGNHDSKERLSFVGDLLEQSGLHIAGTLSMQLKKVSLERNKEQVNIYMLPYIEPYHIKSLFPEAEIKSHDEAVRFYCKDILDTLDISQTNILMAHGMFQYVGHEISETDISVGGSDLVDASIFEKFDFVALGHLHSFHNVGKTFMQYSGSPLKYSIDEAKQKKSFTILDISPDKQINFTQEYVPYLRDVRLIEGCFSFITDRTQQTDFNDYVFVNITDTEIIPQAISRLKAIFPNILGLQYCNLRSNSIQPNKTRMSQAEKKDKTALFSEFYTQVTEEKLDKASVDSIRDIFNSLENLTEHGEKGEDL